MSISKIKFGLILIIGVIFLSSCVHLKELPNTTVRSTDGLHLVENLQKKLSIKYYGDYWFHKLNKESTLNWNNNYIASLKFLKPKLIFCAHTTIDPYCTSVGLVYDKIQKENITENIFSDLRKAFKLYNYSTSPLNVNGIEVKKVSYEIENTKLKVTTQHNEFFFESASKTIRIIFWTTESRDGWMDKEAEGIINTIKGSI